MGGEFAIITFNGEEKSCGEEATLRATWQKCLDLAKEMGADLIYSVEDEAIITQEDIDSLSEESTFDEY